MTLQTQIPDLSKVKNERPDAKAYHEELNNLDKQIENKKKKKAELVNKIKEIALSIDQKNHGVKKQIKDHKITKDKHIEEAKEIKKEIDAFKEQIEKIDEEIVEIKKKTYQGKMWDKEKLANLIQQKETKMMNMLKTAQEEKKMLDEINKMKSTLKYLPQMAKLQAKKDLVYKDFKEVRDKGKKVQEKISKEKGAISKLYDKMNENKAEEEAEKKKEEVQLDENGKPIKKKRALTKEEQDIEDAIQKVKKEIADLY